MLWFFRSLRLRRRRLGEARKRSETPPDETRGSDAPILLSDGRLGRLGRLSGFRRRAASPREQRGWPQICFLAPGSKAATRGAARIRSGGAIE